MMKGMIGRKVGMTQVFDEQGNVIPVTVIEAGPCYVTQIRDAERDGYAAIQLGFEETKPQRLTKGQIGHLQKNNLPALRILREFRVRNGDATELAEGVEIKVDVFSEGDVVDVIGTSKGRGFAGTIKRHGFARGPKTHGQSDRMRSPGSIGMCAAPGRTLKGQRMAGRMGNDRVTVQNLKVVRIDSEKNLLAVRGSVPGARGGIVIIKSAHQA
ncbi:50S ribosomal protein L3 [Phototrophicus methaneseepsis]|uniref:Large ribosomal subunit protein uL3 n=1 Tax=Phototrophicus methaneseepsis TaxID=2710758 RepID=A0A7S8EDW8_9CHLR|nr:50S ribosomal protein L3 [Phototrophicus methaneseepsis]